MTKLESPLLRGKVTIYNSRIQKQPSGLEPSVVFCILLHEWEEKATLLCWHFPLYMLM